MPLKIFFLDIVMNSYSCVLNYNQIDYRAILDKEEKKNKKNKEKKFHDHESTLIRQMMYFFIFFIMFIG